MAPSHVADDQARSEARYRTIFERMPVAFWELDPRGVRAVYDDLRSRGIESFAGHVAAHPELAARLGDMLIVTDVNAETVRMMGATSREQLLGPMGGRFLDAESFIRAGEARFRGANTITDVARVATLDGRTIDVLWTMVFSDEDRPDLNLIGAIDVTERSRAVEELAKSEAKYRILFEHMPLPLVQTNSGDLLALFHKLREEGVEDLGAYIDAHPGFMDRLLETVTIDDVNQPMVRLLGAGEKAEVTGSIARYWKTNPDTVRRSLEARYRGGENLVEETQVDTLDGRLVDIIYSVAYPHELNHLGIGLTAFIDNTGRKRQTEEIRRSEIKFRNLFNRTPIALWQLDSREAGEMLDAFYASGVDDDDAFVAANPDFLPSLRKTMRITEINQAALDLIGATDQDRSSPVIFDHLFDSMDALHAAAARRRGEASFSTESKIRTLDGRTLDVLSSVAFADPDDPDGLHLVAAIDISSRVRAEEELRRNEDKYRTLFNQTPIALWQFNAEAARPEILAAIRSGIRDVDAWLAANPDFFPRVLDKIEVMEINDAALELFGASDRETLRPKIIAHSLQARDVLLASIERARGERSYSVETQIRTLDGRPVDILSKVFFPDPAEPDEGKNLVGAIDISHRKRAEEMLREVQAEFAHAARVATLGELTASIAHEVNQPLAAIVTNGEASLRWLAREEPDIEEVRTLAARMVADARRAADVIARIRTMAAGKAPEHAPLCVNDAAEDAMKFLRHEFELHRTAGRLELMPDLPMVEADWTQLQQVFVNLAVNAMQAMAQHGTAKPTVTVRTSRAPDGGILVEIEDNGPGIPADHVGHLFDSFFTTKEGGLGIGLSICRSIVEAHGGRIEAANLPTGACFSFTLPAAAKGESDSAAAPGPAAASPRPTD